MNKLLELDREAFLALNGLHAEWLDQPMYLFSDTLLWSPLYLLLLYFIIKEYKGESWIILIGIIVMITLSDQVTTSLMKPYFARLRPTHDPSLRDLVHIVNGYRGRSFGFASSHAANTFGVAMFFYLLFRESRKGIFILFAWAAFVSYTRIYLGVHFPGDIIVGAIVGTLFAMLLFKITMLCLEKWRSKPLSKSSGL